MVHLRIVAPPDLAERALDLLRDTPSVCNVIFSRAAAVRPEGDVILCDVAREDASVMLSDLKELEIRKRGSIALEVVDPEISEFADAAERHAKGSPSDAVVWEEIEQHNHPDGIAALDTERVERLGRGIGDWGATDAFGRYVSGPAWLQRRIADADVQRWTESPDRWWRRAALVSTVPLNLRAAGGTGDTARTLEISRRLVSDRDDMVVKALSWALRALAVHDPEAVRAFLCAHPDRVAPRVRREVKSKLATGLKAPPPTAARPSRRGASSPTRRV